MRSSSILEMRGTIWLPSTNKLDPKFVFYNNWNQTNIRYKRNLTSGCKFIQKADIDIELAKAKIHRTTIKNDHYE
jgi:hypothetical protein